MSLPSGIRLMPGDSHHLMDILGHGKSSHPSPKKIPSAPQGLPVPPSRAVTQMGEWAGLAASSQPNQNGVGNSWGWGHPRGIPGAGAGAVAAQLLSSVRMTRSSLVRTRFFSASCRERSRENGDISAAVGKERERRVRKGTVLPIRAFTGHLMATWGAAGKAGGKVSQS